MFHAIEGYCSYLPYILRGLARYRNLKSFHTKPYRRSEGQANLLSKILGCNYNQAYGILKKNPELERTDIRRIIKSAEMLGKFGVTGEELRTCPKVLTILPAVIEQHSLILQESGFPKISANDVLNYRTLVRRKIYLLKMHGYLPEDVDVLQNFLSCVQTSKNVLECVQNLVQLDSNNFTVYSLREIVLRCFLTGLLGATQTEVDHIFSTYSRVQNKSLKLIHSTLSILLKELQFSARHVIDHGFLIHAHPGDLRKILAEFPTLGGMTMRDFLFKHPIVATTSYETFSEILKILRSAGISEKAIIQSPMIFSLSAESVHQGITSMNPKKISPEIKALHSHPQMLRLIARHDHVRLRLSYLSHCDNSSSLPPVTSLNLLCGSPKVFERYVSGDGGYNRGNDTVNYLVKALSNEADPVREDFTVSSSSLRNTLKLHTHWRNVPLFEIQCSLEILLRYGFTCREIFSCIHIVLYSSNKIEEQLKTLSQRSEILELMGDGVNSISNEKHDGASCKIDHSATKCSDLNELNLPPQLRKFVLPLCLYYLEREHHFTGDGIWFR